MPQHQQSRYTDKRFSAVLGFLAVVLGLILIVPNLLSLTALSLGNDIATKTSPLEATTQRILNYMIDQESGLRGYIITADTKFLDPYTSGKVHLADLWDTATAQAAAVGGDAPQLLASVRQSAGDWQSEIAAPQVQMVEQGEIQQAVQLVATGGGKQLFDNFRSDIGALSNYIEQVRGNQTDERNQLLTWLEIILVALSVAGLGALAALYYLNRLSRQYRSDLVASEEIIRAKDEFLSIASHELKTPITSIKGYSQALLRRAKRLSGGNPSAEDWSKTIGQIATIEQQSSKLARMVDDLLDVSRLQTQQLEMNIEPADIVSLSDGVVEQMRTTSDRHKIIVSSEAPKITVNMDEGRIEQVLYNLISNAIKYSPEGSDIKVKLRVEEEEVVCSVSDRGMGIPKEEQGQLFSRFYRASNATATKISGVGLGLYICSGIVSKHGGRMWVDSKVGHGSTFYFSLPLITANIALPEVMETVRSNLPN